MNRSWGAAALLCWLSSGLGSAWGAEIVVTTSILADGVHNIVGRRLQVVALMGAGVDPHLYKPTVRDVRRLEQARVIIANGLKLEGKMEQALRRMARRTPVIFAAELIPPQKLRQVAPGEYDPHVWLDPQLWAEVLRRLADTLGQLFPLWREEFQARAQHYAMQLQELDGWIQQQLERIPRPQRTLITVHEAFGYFGRRYGVRTLALQGVSSAGEFGLARVLQLAELVHTRALATLFAESSTPVRALEGVAMAVRWRGGRVRIAGPLYTDALGKPGSPEGSYLGMMRMNVERIVHGLLPQP